MQSAQNLVFFYECHYALRSRTWRSSSWSVCVQFPWEPSLQKQENSTSLVPMKSRDWCDVCCAAVWMFRGRKSPFNDDQYQSHDTLNSLTPDLCAATFFNHWFSLSHNLPSAFNLPNEASHWNFTKLNVFMIFRSVRNGLLHACEAWLWVAVIVCLSVRTDDF